MLYPRLPLFKDESTNSWLQRLATFHGAGTFDLMGEQLGINPEGLRYGDSDDIARLAQVTGESPALIHRNLLSLTRTGGQRIGPHALSHLLRPVSERYVCFRCLRQDAKAGSPGFHLRERWEWRLATSQKCSRHDRELTPIDPEDEHWREGFTCPATPMKKPITTAPDDSRFHDWPRQELQQRSKSGWSADMSLPDAVDAVGVIGAAIGMGSGERWQDLEFASKQLALNIGHDLVCGDREALRPALLARQEKDGTSFGRGRNNGSPLGALHSWMRHRREIAPGAPLTKMFLDIFT